jgi:hypothetical protein
VKISIRHLMVLSLLFLVAGCATRVGSSTKLSGYDTKFKDLSIVYTQGKLGDDGLSKKLQRYNFQNMGEYVTKAAPQTFSNFGINATVYTRTSNSENVPAKDKQIVFIAPIKSSTTAHINSFNGDVTVASGPSTDPVKVEFEVNVFDALLKKEVWKGDFSVVAGGLLYSSFNEEKAASFLTDILEKLEKDGLVNRTL